MNGRLATVLVVIAAWATMTLEVVGARLLTPHFGSGSLVWTAVLATVLAGLSLGYGLGGIFVRRGFSGSALPLAWLGAGLSIGIDAVWGDAVLRWLASTGASPMIAAVAGGVLLFVPANLLLASMVPCLTQDLAHSRSAGAVVSRLSAWSAIGSIGGTLVSGLLLLPSYGHGLILAATAAASVAVGVGLLAWQRRLSGMRHLAAGAALAALGAAVLALFSAKSGAVKDFDTAFDRYRLYDYLGEDGHPMRVLQTGKAGIQAAIRLDDPGEVVVDYLKAFRIDKSLRPDARHALLIGGAAMIFPRDFVQRFPEATLDVVEIDGALVDVAKRYFHFQTSERIRVVVDDGRRFLDASNERYDLIYMDAFRAVDVPFHLVTTEAWISLARHLDARGVLIMNVVDRLEDGKDELVKAICATMAPHFADIRVFRVDEHGTFGNWTVVGLKSRLGPDMTAQPALASLLRKEHAAPVGGRILTDDYAPVERLTWLMGM